MERSDQVFHYKENFTLEAGGSLPAFQLKYSTLGKLNEERSNVIWVCHALTGNSDFTDWWSGLFTIDGPFDPSRNFIICANMLGGCYGSTGPLSINPESGLPYYHEFPQLTIRDVVKAYDLLREELRITKVHTLIGGSLGGQQVLEWAIEKPDLFQHIIPIACNAFHSPWGIAFNEAQRMAIEADPTWKLREPRAGMEGLKAARAIGMLSYRQYDTYGETQAEKNNERIDDFRAATYQRYQGEKLVNRFNAFTYRLFSKVMDSHNVGRSRGSVTKALASIQAKALVVGIESDLLFPLTEQQYLSQHIPRASFEVISSIYGHDGFLVEFDQLKNIIKHYFKQLQSSKVLA
jgi:homoserine O-acetyltransferase/O-succinyltransferase